MAAVEKEATVLSELAEGHGEAALGGPVTTNSLHGQNSNHEKEKAVDGWRRERKKLKQALKNSPAYIRGSLYTPAKKKEKKGKSARKREQRRDCEGIKPASPVKHKQMLKRNPRKARRGKGGNNPCKFSLTEMSLGEEDLPDSCASFTSTSESEDWSGSCPSLTSTSETESEDSDDENPKVPHNTPEEQSSDEDKGDPSVAPLRLRGGGGPSSEDEESDYEENTGGQLKLSLSEETDALPKNSHSADGENSEEEGKKRSVAENTQVRSLSTEAQQAGEVCASSKKTKIHGCKLVYEDTGEEVIVDDSKGNDGALVWGEKRLREGRQCQYDFPSEEDDIKDISGASDDSDKDQE